MPLGDDNADRRSVPFVNYALIAMNVLVFLVLQQGGLNERFLMAWACVPEEIVTGRDLVTDDRQVPRPDGPSVTVPGLQPTPVSVYLTLLTSMFMHGGIAHLFGNMLFLWIFGDNVEDRLGKLGYLAFYLVCGLLASLAHVATTYVLGRDQQIPSLGASGAISGVLGGYLLLFPYKRVTVLLLRVLTRVPAWVAVGMWFLFQIVESTGLLGGSEGIAYGAHIGGFLAGMALVFPFALLHDRLFGPPPVRRGPTLRGGPVRPRF